jgi:serine/threonine-protein kinase RsbW
MTNPQEVELLHIPSALENLEQVDSAVERIACAMGFSENACADIGICATEAITNAIVHAHGQNPKLIVEVKIERYADHIQIAVRDHGGGFEIKTVPDPTLPENLMKDSGRGLHLIRALMDNVLVERHADGMMIIMIKYLNGIS